MNKNAIRNLIKRFEQVGQSHVFHGFENLSTIEQLEIVESANSINLEHLSELIDKAKSFDLEKKRHSHLVDVNDLLRSPHLQNPEEYKEFIIKGEQAIREGRVCALLVAGGDGSRLGFSGPKGMLPVTLVKKKSLFQIFAEQIQVAQKRYNSCIPWLIMTSDSNHDTTKEYFINNNNFGFNEIHFFKQNVCPIINFEGKLILDERRRIAMAPDGHGGCLEALASNGLIEKMEKSGITIISYFQVDNPLIKCIDPLFIGLHLASEAEMSCKTVKKRDAQERVGIFCQDNGKIKVVEYTHVSQEILELTDSNNKIVYNAGNVGAHLMDLSFVKRMNDLCKMTFYHTKKKVPYLDLNNNIVTPNEPNALKFEKLIFDILPEAKNVLLMEVLREEEFSPIKNAEGPDSLESFKKDQLSRYIKWFKQAGIEISEPQESNSIFNIEISPFFADNQCDFIEKWSTLLQKPEILTEIYLE